MLQWERFTLEEQQQVMIIAQHQDTGGEVVVQRARLCSSTHNLEYVEAAGCVVCVDEGCCLLCEGLGLLYVDER